MPRPSTTASVTSGDRTGPKFRRWAINAVISVGIAALTVVLLDLLLIALGLFPPTYRYGEPRVGWIPALPSGKIREWPCLELSTHQQLAYVRNEQGVRTSYSAATLREDNDLFKIMVGGDSHTELCAPNGETHFGVLERELNASGLRSASLGYGAGMYSPLQAYLAVKNLVTEYSADALVLNLYTGNDFYDMLRIDDRPHFVTDGNGYRIADPVWYAFDAPGTKRRSRILSALHSMAQKTGLRDTVLRIRYLRAVAAQEGLGVGAVIDYMNDLRKAASGKVAYQHAFSAQMLNQQLFFHHFSGSKQESIRRVKTLLEMARRENPGVLLILSPIPSYELALNKAIEPALAEVLQQLPITYASGVAQERELYEALRTLAVETGWVFVDTLPGLRQYQGSDPLFNNADYHIRPNASQIIGRAQAAVIMKSLHSRSGKPVQ
ncbi:MAG: hypothetical protein ACRENP_05980 [Longimicrobiales bacterium]